jgi:hypothetical protein
MSDFEVQYIEATVAAGQQSIVAAFNEIADVDRAALFPANSPHTTAGFGRPSGALNNSLRSITSTAEVISVDEVSFDDYNTTVFLANKNAAWLLTYTGDVAGPNEFVNRLNIDLTIAAAATTVDSAAIPGIVSAADLVPLIFVACDQNSADFSSHFPTVELVNTGGSTWVLRVTRQGSSGTMRIIGRVMEFTGANWTVQKKAHTFVASATNEDEVLDTTVDPDNSFTISYMKHTQVNQPVQQQFYAYLSDENTLRHRITTKPATSPVVNTWILTNPLVNVTRYGTPDGTPDLTGSGGVQETADVAITAVTDTTQVMVIGYAGSNSAATTTCPAALRNYRLFDSDTVRLSRSDGLGDSDYVLQVIDFYTASAPEVITVSDIGTVEDTLAFTITGTGFGADEGTVTIGGVTQTITNWTDTEIDCVAIQSTNPFIALRSIVITRPDAVTATDEVGFAVPSGHYATTVRSLILPTTWRIEPDLPLEVSDQLHVKDVTGVTSGFTLALDGSWRSTNTVIATFECRCWDHDDETWGSWGTQTVILDLGIIPDDPDDTPGPINRSLFCPSRRWIP